MLMLFIPQITYNGLRCGPKRFSCVFVQASIQGTAKCFRYISIFKVCRTLSEENTRYNNCPIAYSDFIKTYFGEHNYTFNYFTTPPLKSMNVYLNLNIHVFDNSFLSYRCQVRLPCILGIVHKNGTSTTVLPFVCKSRV